jgi:hypothetical protein
VKRYLGVVAAAALLVGMMAVATDALAAGHGGGGGGGSRGGPHGRWVPRALAGKRPLAASADLQSIDSIHCAFIARDPRLAGKSGVGIWQWLKRCANSVAL